MQQGKHIVMTEYINIILNKICWSKALFQHIYFLLIQTQDQGGYIPYDATQQLIKFYQSYVGNALSNSSKFVLHIDSIIIVSDC